jgi:hypothetical protein
MTLQGWFALVQEFTNRETTRSSDRLPAISSVMQRIATARGWVPIWGMWSNFIDQSLAWSVNDLGYDGKHRCRVHPKYNAPSWSWASIEGPVDFGNCGSQDPYKISSKVIKLNPTTGVITVLALCNFALIRCRVERPYTTPEVLYIYECTTVRQNIDPARHDLPAEMPISPDVALRPVKRNLSLLEDGTIIRVPHGEDLPQETWTCKCLCLLLGHTKTTANVLLLGESQRIPGTYERVGLAFGWPPSMFTPGDELPFDIS